MKCSKLILLPVMLALAVAARPAEAVELNYSLYFLGVSAADAKLSFDIAEASYRLTLAFHTTGIADLFVGDRLEEHTSGRFEKDQPAPADYASNGHLRGQDRVVDMTWHDGMPTITAITPANRTEREDVSTPLLAHTVNPLDAFVLLLHQVARTGRCEGSSRAYDGRRLQLLEARTLGEEDLPESVHSSYAGHALRCEFTDRTLAGFRTGAGRDNDLKDHRGTIWFSQVLPGLPRLPVRASVETRWFGDAVIYLKSIVR